jgi:Na+/H+ antiporter NhaD/arsenite permease-like protein
VLLSQLLSNVPLVALYLPLLTHAGASTKEMMALVAGSTIVGNMLILGTASSVISFKIGEERRYIDLF